MEIDWSVVKHRFGKKPLLFAGAAMEYYGLRLAGNDVDFLVAHEDFLHLTTLYPGQIREEANDRAVCLGSLELWQTICDYTYEQLEEGALDTPTYRVLTLEKLLLLKAHTVETEKSQQDILFLAKRIQREIQGTHRL